MAKNGKIRYLYDYMFQKKKEDALTREILEALQTVTFNMKNAQIVGSFIYRAQPFPSDIDLSEKFLPSQQLTDEQAVKVVSERLRILIEKIQRSESYLGDVKIGYDPALYALYFFFLAGFTGLSDKQEGDVIWESVKPEFRKDLLLQYLGRYLQRGLVTKESYRELTQALRVPHPDIEEVYELLRQLYTLRWSADEVLQGYKDLPGDRRISLSEALQDPALVKIDLWSLIQEKWTEVTNVLDLSYNKGEKVLNSDIPNILTVVQDDIYKLASSKHFEKPFKLAKRLFSAARLIKNEKDAQVLVDLFRSDYGSLNQIRSEIATLGDMIEGLPQPPVETINRQIDNFKQRFSTILSVQLDFDQIYSLIDSIIKQKYFNKEDVLKKLDSLSDYLKKKIDPFTKEYLTAHGLLPVPKRYHLEYPVKYYQLPPFHPGPDIDTDPFVLKLLQIKKEFE